MQETKSKPDLCSHDTVLAQVAAMRLEAPDVLSLELRAVDGQALPPADPGAHVDLHLPNGAIRPYSIVANDDGTYLVAVKREAAGKGGSAYIHERLRVGEQIRVAVPRNHFALVGDAEHSVLIAGGIGITPLIPMARALARADRSWHLHYAAREPSRAPFARALGEFGGAVRTHSSASAGRLDLKALVAAAPAGTHFYCCGPESMLDAFADATREIAAERVHMERFGPAALPADAGCFEVRLARSGRQLVVAAEVSLLDALLEAGVDIDHSCRQGICGSCEVRVLEGVPEHRDELLTESERATNKTMMACCSRACSPTLTLDL